MAIANELPDADFLLPFEIYHIDGSCTNWYVAQSGGDGNRWIKVWFPHADSEFSDFHTKRGGYHKEYAGIEAFLSQVPMLSVANREPDDSEDLWRYCKSGIAVLNEHAEVCAAALAESKFTNEGAIKNLKQIAHMLTTLNATKIRIAELLEDRHGNSALSAEIG